MQVFVMQRWREILDGSSPRPRTGTAPPGTIGREGGTLLAELEVSNSNGTPLASARPFSVPKIHAKRQRPHPPMG